MQPRALQSLTEAKSSNLAAQAAVFSIIKLSEDAPLSMQYLRAGNVRLKITATGGTGKHTFLSNCILCLTTQEGLCNLMYYAINIALL
jgi:hypothetical protein